MINNHIPVMTKELVDNLSIKEGDVYVDCTFGGGGHSKKILELIGKNGRLISFDRDFSAIKWSEALNCDNFLLINDNFSNLAFHLERLLIKKVDGFLFDLGLSSMQIESDRGFSYRYDSPLDMRMDDREGLTASHFINNSSAKELADIFYHFGQERKAYKIANALFNYSRKKKIETSDELTKITASVIGKQKGKGHPSKKVFQALRIKVNNELENLKKALECSCNYLAPMGKIAVISYHSLEDKVVKLFFKEKAIDKESYLLLFKKPILPSNSEIKRNNRSRSAKLRILCKLV